MKARSSASGGPWKIASAASRSLINHLLEKVKLAHTHKALLSALPSVRILSWFRHQSFRMRYAAIASRTIAAIGQFRERCFLRRSNSSRGMPRTSLGSVSVIFSKSPRSPYGRSNSTARIRSFPLDPTFRIACFPVFCSLVLFSLLSIGAGPWVRCSGLSSISASWPILARFLMVSQRPGTRRKTRSQTSSGPHPRTS